MNYIYYLMLEKLYEITETVRTILLLDNVIRK
jgi:hypothetical protein